MKPTAAPPIGLKFQIHIATPWGGPCPNCNRRRALKRKYRGELPCTNHQPLKEWERSVWNAEITAHGEGAMQVSYKTTGMVSMENPLKGTTGMQMNGGGMTVAHFWESVQSGRVVIL